MSIQAAAAVAEARIHDQDRRLRGAWLIVARVAWLAVALLTVVYLVVSLPVEFARLRNVCTASACPFSVLDAINVRELAAIGRSVDFFAIYVIAGDVVFAVVACVVGGIIFWRKSDERMALFVALMLVTFGSLAFAASFDIVAAEHGMLRWAFAGVFFLGNISPVLFFFLFPDGRFVPHWTRVPAVIVVVLGVFFHFFRDSLIFQWLTSPYGSVVSVGIIATAVWSQFYRYRRVSGQLQRQQTKWVVWGIAMAMTGSQSVQELLPLLGHPHVLVLLGANTLLKLSVLLIPLSIGIAILRYHLWDIDLLINRTLVYGALTASVVAVYVFVVGYLGALFRTGGNLAISLVATGVVAVLFQPLRDRFQRGINRLLYGERDDPYTVVTRLGQRLEGTLAPDAVLGTLVETVVQALKLPYAAVLLTQGDGFVTAAEYPAEETRSQGDKEKFDSSLVSLSPDLLVALPLIYQGETVGKLLLAPRGPGESFSPADRRLLSVLAQQAGVAAHTVRLTTDLQHSRERLITAREEERRRLRRDLHDGVGPTLASMAQRIDAATYMIRDDPHEAITLLQGLKGQVRSTLADIRRLVYALRPPALDEFGLLAAIREHASQYTGMPVADTNSVAALQVIVEAPETLPPLSAAVELAAYRIALEALTNVAHHSQATTCRIRLSVVGVNDRQALSVEVCDDGAGLPAEHRAGVGLASMRERAAELGGICTIDASPGGGTRVCAWLPLS